VQNNYFPFFLIPVAFFNRPKTAWAKDFRGQYAKTLYSKAFYGFLRLPALDFKNMRWGKILVKSGFQQLFTKRKITKKILLQSKTVYICCTLKFKKNYHEQS